MFRLWIRVASLSTYDPREREREKKRSRKGFQEKEKKDRSRCKHRFVPVHLWHEKGEWRVTIITVFLQPDLSLMAAKLEKKDANEDVLHMCSDAVLQILVLLVVY